MLKSVQFGVDDFMSKPFALDQFLLKLKNTSKILNLNSSISKLELELQNLNNELGPITQKIRELFSDIQHMRFPEKDREIDRIISATMFVSKQLSNDADELKEIELAASICHLPKAMFKDRMAELPVMVNGIVENQNMLAYHEHIKKLFTGFRGFEQTVNILNSVYENFDGSGVPNKLKAWAIPLGARVLRVAIEFETHYSRNPKTVDKIIPLLWTEINRLYDFRVLAFYDQYLGYLNTQNLPARRATEVVVNPYALEKGMVLSRNIITISGLKLLSIGTKLDVEAIKKIQEAKSNEAYIGHIFVKIESVPLPSDRKKS
jgi:response regulator RpfG family c-di-GMP phosphodiesterase